MGKRIILTALAILMVFVLGACSPNNGDKSDTSKKADVDKTWLPDITLGEDKKVVVLSQLDEGSELFEEHYGGQVEVIKEPGDIMTKFMTMSMGGERIDLLRTVLKPVLATQGYLKPIDGLIDFEDKLWKDIKEANALFTHNDGKNYLAMIEQNRSLFVWYNKEIFEEFGIDSPEKHVKEGTWDWNVMRQMAKDLTVERNGQYEQYGLCIDEGDAFLYSSGKHLVSFVSGQKATNNVKSEEVARAVNFYTDLVNVDKVVYTETGARQAFPQGKIAMIAGGMWYYSLWPEMLKNDTAMFVPFPKDPNADKYYVQEQAAGYMMPSTAKNEIGASAFIACKRLAILDTSNREEGLKQMKEDYGWDTKHIEMYEKYALSPDKVGVPVSYVSFDIGQFFGDFLVRPSKGEPWATIASEIEPKINDQITLAYEK